MANTGIDVKDSFSTRHNQSHYSLCYLTLTPVKLSSIGSWWFNH